jgi:hypothetical protein
MTPELSQRAWGLIAQLAFEGDARARALLADVAASERAAGVDSAAAVVVQPGGAPLSAAERQRRRRAKLKASHGSHEERDGRDGFRDMSRDASRDTVTVFVTERDGFRDGRDAVSPARDLKSSAILPSYEELREKEAAALIARESRDTVTSERDGRDGFRDVSRDTVTEQTEARAAAAPSSRFLVNADDPVPLQALRGRRWLRDACELRDWDHGGQWQRALAQIALKPEAERAAVARTLLADPARDQLLAKLTPQHVLDYWATYASGERPGKRAPAKPQPSQAAHRLREQLAQNETRQRELKTARRSRALTDDEEAELWKLDQDHAQLLLNVSRAEAAA